MQREFKSKDTKIGVNGVINLLDSVVTDYDIWRDTRSRKLHLVWRRALYYYFLYKYTSLSLEQVGGLFEGNTIGRTKRKKDHATIRHSIIQLHDVYLKYDAQIKSFHDIIESRIKELDGFIDETDTKESMAEKMVKYKRSKELFKDMFRRQTINMVNLRSENIQLKKKLKLLSGGLRQNK